MDTGSGRLPETEPSREGDEGFYDDSGRWWPSNAEWCDRCQGMGTEECLCAGDFCCCGAVDNLECRRCHGEGYYILTDAMKAEREEVAKWWHGLWNDIAQTPPPSPLIMDAHTEMTVLNGEGK